MTTHIKTCRIRCPTECQFQRALKITKLVFALITLLPQFTWASEPEYNLYLGKRKQVPVHPSSLKHKKVSLSAIGTQKAISRSTLNCVAKLKDKLNASKTFESMRPFVTEVTFQDFGQVPEPKFSVIELEHQKNDTGHAISNKFSMAFSFDSTSCHHITLKDIDEQIQYWINQYAIELASMDIDTDKINQAEERRRSIQTDQIMKREGTTHQSETIMRELKALGGK